MKTKNKIKEITTLMLLTSSFGLLNSANAQVSHPSEEISAQIQLTMENINKIKVDVQKDIDSARSNAANSSEFNHWLGTLPSKLDSALLKFEGTVRDTLIPRAIFPPVLPIKALLKSLALSM